MNGDTEERLDVPRTIRVTLSDGSYDDHEGVDRFYVTGNGTLVLMGPQREFIHAYASGHWKEYEPWTTSRRP